MRHLYADIWTRYIRLFFLPSKSMLSIIHILKSKVRTLEKENESLKEKLAMEEGRVARLEAENKELNERLDRVLVQLMVEHRVPQ